MLQMPFAVQMVCYTWTQPTGTARNQLSELAQTDRHRSDWPTAKPTMCCLYCTIADVSLYMGVSE